MHTMMVVAQDLVRFLRAYKKKMYLYFCLKMASGIFKSCNVNLLIRICTQLTEILFPALKLLLLDVIKVCSLEENY